MGVSPVVIGLLPSYESTGVLAPLLLALCRFGQGFCLGGECGGAVLLATETSRLASAAGMACSRSSARPSSLFLSSGVFWILLHFISQENS